MKNAQLLLGRFQPFHNGHSRIVNAMKNPVITVVKGAKSSQVDIIPSLKEGDSSRETAMPCRENVPSCIDISIM